MKTVLRIDNLFKDFSGLQVLSGITIDILAGERHVIIGPNGAGKTTLFNIITGLYRPTRENSTFWTKILPQDRRKRSLGSVSQGPSRSSISFHG